MRNLKEFVFKPIPWRKKQKKSFTMLSLVSKSPEETKEFGKKIGKNLFNGTIIALSGKLGSGKTTLIQGIGEGLGIISPIKSPSFTFINEYQGTLPLYHFDLYRLNTEGEIESLGYEEYFYSKGVSVVEWADRALEVLPEKYIEVKFRHLGKNKREIKISV